MEENEAKSMWEATQWFILENYALRERQDWTATFRRAGLSPTILDQAEEILAQREREKAQQPKCEPEPPKLTCLRCNGEWTPRSEKQPTQCPKCHSPYWKKERVYRK